MRTPIKLAIPKSWDRFTFTGGDYDQAIAFWLKEKIRKGNIPGWLWHTLQSDRFSRIGLSYAAMGDVKNAQIFMDSIQQIPNTHPTIPGIRNYYKSRILVWQGKKEAAIESLENAWKEGFHAYGPVRYASDPFLKPVFNHPNFLALITPKSLK